MVFVLSLLPDVFGEIGLNTGQVELIKIKYAVGNAALFILSLLPDVLPEVGLNTMQVEYINLKKWFKNAPYSF